MILTVAAAAGVVQSVMNSGGSGGSGNYTVEQGKKGGYTTEGAGSNTQQQLKQIATKVNQSVSGSGTVSGTLKHTEFAKQVKALSNSGLVKKSAVCKHPNEFSPLQTEVTFKNGLIVSYRTKGGVRVDVVEFNPNGTIKAVYNLKTGNAELTTQRIQQIQNNLPNNAPVFEIRS